MSAIPSITVCQIDPGRERLIGDDSIVCSAGLVLQVQILQFRVLIGHVVDEQRRAPMIGGLNTRPNIGQAVARQLNVRADYLVGDWESQGVARAGIRGLYPPREAVFVA